MGDQRLGLTERLRYLLYGRGLPLEEEQGYLQPSLIGQRCEEGLELCDQRFGEFHGLLYVWRVIKVEGLGEVREVEGEFAELSPST
jgi:hypothetical protein